MRKEIRREQGMNFLVAFRITPKDAPKQIPEMLLLELIIVSVIHTKHCYVEFDAGCRPFQEMFLYSHPEVFSTANINGELIAVGKFVDAGPIFNAHQSVKGEWNPYFLAGQNAS